eukprot:GHRR01035262.1.p1 GENE.GHRR01035262.1~~GHRR01035262.1.p1  ORF type:complete len:199 (+),score=78.10 GHRR01035262.1:215-811(+)
MAASSMTDQKAADTAVNGPAEAKAGPSVNSAADDTAGCPICQFIEAGPCGDQHKVWIACRHEAKTGDKDFVQHCAEQFRTFFGCMLSHQDYYQPFLEAFNVDVDRSQEAIDTVKARQQEQQQGHHFQQQPTAANSAQATALQQPNRQQHQQQPPPQANAPVQHSGSRAHAAGGSRGSGRVDASNGLPQSAGPTTTAPL